MIRTLPALLTVLTVGAVTLAAHPFQAARLDISGTWTGKTIITKEGAPPSEEGLHAVLKQHGCEPIPGVGNPFDPHQHEAIAQEPSTEHPAGTVTRVTQVGYKLHDRVVRPAQVLVSTGPAK